MVEIYPTIMDLCSLNVPKTEIPVQSVLLSALPGVGLSLCDNRLPEPTKYLLEGRHLLYIADFTWEVNLNKTSGQAVGQLRSHLTDCKSPWPVISTHQIRRRRSLLASICPHFGLHRRASPHLTTNSIHNCAA
jgi:hypothetical protein